MLREIAPIRQHDGEFRRMFSDDFFDLYIWYESEDSQNKIIGFQLCYDKGKQERALTWLADSGLKHSWVDTGDDSPKANRTPTLIHGCEDDFDWILSVFLERSANIGSLLRSFVYEHLTSQPRAQDSSSLTVARQAKW